MGETGLGRVGRLASKEQLMAGPAARGELGAQGGRANGAVGVSHLGKGILIWEGWSGLRGEATAVFFGFDMICTPRYGGIMEVSCRSFL